MFPHCCHPPKKFQPVTHVIFDLDGTIIDTETINQAAFRAIGEEYGKKFTVEMKNNIAGCVQKETARRLVEYMDLPITPEECLETFLSFTRDKLPDCDYMPGVHWNMWNRLALSCSKSLDLSEKKIVPKLAWQLGTSHKPNNHYEMG
ncbi:unnamed protein product [Acanthoscelides obtectus]|uniref:Uncharacterized protein n=1 Tax=Acanthoscelides obtectus TaxID=200917 RepID=A0A9P0JWG7_ACAOB|nr:unnamed protein product [Acanthoscelides obtectus]CAK1625233.1 Pseudouridine-5'-phosphatase [Acanthoscelides obtectus]